jgi:tetratricopeptide (TPR) repeat protein
MAATVLIEDDAFTLLADDIPIGHCRKLDPKAIAVLQSFSDRYGQLTHRFNPVDAIALGREFYRWIDGSERLFHRLLEHAERPLLLTIHCPGRTPGPAEWALLDAPWELLADERTFLAADPLLQFSPYRRLGPVRPATPPDGFRLGLAFMAAAPEGVSELDYEAEENAILDAVGATHLDLLVEESGEAETLGRHLVDAGRPPILHLSCHGNNAWQDKPGEPPRPVLLLEDGRFGQRPTDAPTLLKALRPAMPRLVFLSACLTAAASGNRDRSALPPEPGSRDSACVPQVQDSEALIQSLCSALVLAGLPAILGWAGSVADVAAIRFAAEFYGCLARREGLALAVAAGRRVLLDATDERIRRDWHLARLWVGSKGDGAGSLVAGQNRRSLLPADHGQQAFLGKEVLVASHAMFVGRRRELQQALRALDSTDSAGILLTGMGRLGKSSLAARIVNRRRDLDLVVLHGRFGVGALIEKLEAAVQPRPALRELLRAGKVRVLAAARQGREAELQALGDLLTDLLSGEHGWPLLMVLDDFEQWLEEAPGVRPIIDAYAGLIATVLGVFRLHRTPGRLLITSRFPFTLPAGQEELAGRFKRIELRSFNATAERKLTLRQLSAARQQRFDDLAAREALLPRACAAARGNPGLLDLLSAGLVLNPAVPRAEAETAIVEMEAYLAGGELPASEKLRAQLESIAVQTLLKLAGASGQALLRALTLFELALPRNVVEGLAGELGGQIQALIDLALVEPAPHPVHTGNPALRISPLAAGLLPPLTSSEQSAIATRCAALLFAAWGGETNERPAIAELQLTLLALAAEDPAVAAACGAAAIGALESDSYEVAAALATSILGLLEQKSVLPSMGLMTAAARVIHGSGDGERADALLARGIDLLRNGDEASSTGALVLLAEYATRLHRRGKLDEALRICREKVLPGFDRLGDVRSKAVTMGQIADILEARGELDEARRIRREEELPVYDRLGDVRSKAVTMGKIADILEARGELDEARRIRREEELPVYDRLGDVRSKAVTMGKIADILEARGELDEVLRIRREEELPVYERLGDVRSKAVTMGKIADILQARGELDEALRIRREEELPVYERLGDVREKAVTMGKIADILQARGELDEALRIRREEELPVYDRLGDVRSKAVTMGKIADILQARGELDEALCIRREEQLPVYDRLGDVRSKAVTMGKIADILQARGEFDEALRIRREEELPVYERLGDVRLKAVTMGCIADILQARGELDEALRIRREEELPVYDRLGDVRSKAITMGQIADILEARGELDEARRIRREEELPVYERLGDVRSKAVTMGKIADILEARGELDEALRIRREEELPVYDRLGDVRSKAVTMGKIADILQARGELDEALRIRREEQLPVYERLGDVRSLLVCRAKLAIGLMNRRKGDDPVLANNLLCLALADARKLRIPEAAQIEQILLDFDMTCG